MASLSRLRSAISTFEQPPASAASAIMMPIGPAPITAATSPGTIRARVAACMPMANGSTKAPSAKDTLSGSLKVKAAGWIAKGVSTPWIGGVAQKPDSRIDIVEAEFRGAGAVVRNAWLHADPVADRKPGHLRSHFHNRAGRFMAQHHRLVDDIGSDGAVSVIVHVAAADADRVDGNLDVARPQDKR